MTGLPRTAILAIAIVLVLPSLGSAQDHEKKIQRSDLPPAVEKTVAAQSKGAEVRGFSKEVEKGQTFYEAELSVSGRSKDVLIDKSGAVVEIEEQVSVDSLDSSVRNALQEKAGKGKITKVEKLIKKDQLVAYEAQVLSNGKKSEVQVGPDGKPLDHEE